MPFDPAAFKNAEGDFAYDEPPSAGEFETRLTKSDIITANKDGRQSVKLTWTVLSGFARDHEWGSWHTLEALDRQGEPSGGLAITKRTLRDLGIDVDRVDGIVDLRRELDRVTGVDYVVETAKNGQWWNTKVLRPLEQTAMPAIPPGPRPSNAIYGSDAPEAQSPTGQGILGPDEVRRDLQKDPNASDIPGAGPGEFQHAPARGEIDPETGEPIPF